MFFLPKKGHTPDIEEKKIEKIRSHLIILIGLHKANIGLGVIWKLNKITAFKTYKEIGWKDIICVIFPLRPNHFDTRFLKHPKPKFCHPYSDLFNIHKG